MSPNLSQALGLHSRNLVFDIGEFRRLSKDICPVFIADPGCLSGTNGIKHCFCRVCVVREVSAVTMEVV
jgi:hypothetical protein